MGAEVPNLINYQGRLKDSTGALLDTTADLTFTIFADIGGTTTLWTEVHNDVAISNGLFAVLLGSVTPFGASLWDEPNRYLGLQINGEPLIDPLMPITSAAYARRAAGAARADTADHALISDSASYADTAAYALASPGGAATGWADDGSVVRLTTGSDRVGIGTSSPSENLVVGGNVGSFPEANYVVSGNPDFEGLSGYKLGWNADNHATIDWYGDSDALRFSTRSMGANYNNTMVMRAGMVGINNDYPQEPLVVGPGLGASYGDLITIARTGTDRYSGIMFGEDAQNKANIIWYNNTNEMRLQTESNDVAYSNTLVLKDGNVGIGTTSPEENLVVGEGLGSFNGNRIVVGGNAAGSQTGLVFGESEISRGWLLWDVNSNFISLGLRDAGTAHNDILVLKDGNVDIGADYSHAKVHVESAYDLILGETRHGIFNNVISEGNGVTIGLHSHVHQQQVLTGSPAPEICALDGYATATNPACTTSIGVRGESWGAYKCYGVQAIVNTATQFGVGIYAHATAANEQWAGIFDGPVDMPSELYCTSLITRIDHPLDPEHKYLQHASVESNEMMNVYSGNVILTENGEATVELPDWFSAINRDIRYQLTCIGGYAPVYIAEKVHDNRFHIAGGMPGLEVSWQVSCARSDPYAMANQLAVEIDKSSDDRGYYRNPKAFGRSEAQSTYQKHRAVRPQAEQEVP